MLEADYTNTDYNKDIDKSAALTFGACVAEYNYDVAHGDFISHLAELPGVDYPRLNRWLFPTPEPDEYANSVFTPFLARDLVRGKSEH